MTKEKKIGNDGEILALQLLQQKGYLFLAQNYFCKWGEIDIIVKDPHTHEIVFVEVKTRKNNAFGSIYESITQIKFERMERSAICYLEERDSNASYRFDAIYISQKRIDHETNIGFDL